MNYKMTISHNLETTFYAGLTIYLPTCVQNFVEISRHLAMLWQKCIVLFWNTVNFVGSSVIHVSQGSVATYVRCGGMSTLRCIANFLLSLSVKDFFKSIKIW